MDEFNFTATSNKNERLSKSGKVNGKNDFDKETLSFDQFILIMEDQS